MNGSAARDRWPACPVILEINTVPWLRETSERYGVAPDLAALPQAAWEEAVPPEVDAVWLMGAWERSRASRAIALANESLVREFREALPDMAPEDVIGSAYAVRSYTADPLIGGEEGLRAARQALARRGIRLILDFVPNHVAVDHAWAAEAPQLLLAGSPEDLRRAPGEYCEAGGRVFAHGRDPHFLPWQDTIQVNVFAPGAHAAAVRELENIARHCDGVRCDMAMLVTTAIFEKTWGTRAGSRPAVDYWAAVIEGVRAAQPGFLFLAEAYWETEQALLQQGFDFCYDKALYDRLRTGGASAVRDHLAASAGREQRLVRFLENHDETRLPVAFGPERGRAAAVATLSLPGARLLLEGQREGKRTRLPVFLARRPAEPPDVPTKEFYDRLLRVLDHPACGPGAWQMLPTRGWPDNRSNENLLAWAWERGDARLLVVVNYSGAPAQGRIAFPWPGATAAERRLRDLLTGEVYWRATAELEEHGLFVDLGPWQSHVLDATPSG